MKKKSMDILRADMTHLVFYAENSIKEDQRKNYSSSIKYIQRELKRIMENIK